MKVLISGASGLVGSELVRQLTARGDEAYRLVRRAPENNFEIQWDPETQRIPEDALDGIDAVVNLAGATTGKIPWTKKYKQEIVSSRINSTKTLVSAINRATNKPKVLVSGSASGFYGDKPGEVLTETSPKGTGFLSDLAAQWEAEAAKAETRVVLVRTTMVMSKSLGALGRLLPLIKLGIGGPLGSGKQDWAWISLVDEARAIIHLIENQRTEGAYNLTAPEPATCGQIVASLAKKLHRPAIIPVPKFALNLLIGEAARELLLCSQNMSADKLISSGFQFTHPTLDQASAWVVEKN